MLRIADAREARGWTQEQLAQAIGTTQQTIQRWETGQTDPQVSKIEAISNALGITMSYILGVDADGNESNSLTADELAMVEIMRNVSPEGIRQLMIYARGVEQIYPKNNKVHVSETA